MGRKFIEIFSKRKQISVFCLIFGVFCAVSASAQPKHEQYLAYIEQYKHAALKSEREFGVPASITLAQGMLESNVGKSNMAIEANNHFGIKAYHWTGEVYGRDSVNKVGYRKYGTVEDSYLDHAKFLNGPRYSILQQFDVTDYRSWAQGLRDCGYAEDANYPAKLIGLIEQYELYALDGKSQEGATVSSDEGNGENQRWHHRKRRNRQPEQPTVTSRSRLPPLPSHTHPCAKAESRRVPTMSDFFTKNVPRFGIFLELCITFKHLIQPDILITF